MSKLIFLTDTHKSNYAKCLVKDRTSLGDKEREALFYILSGVSDIWNKGVDNFYDFSKSCIKTNCFKKVDLCSSSKSLIYLAFNLYNGFNPKGGLNIVDLFSSLDRENRTLAINALNMRFGG